MNILRRLVIALFPPLSHTTISLDFLSFPWLCRVFCCKLTQAPLSLPVSLIDHFQCFIDSTNLTATHFSYPSEVLLVIYGYLVSRAVTLLKAKGSDGLSNTTVVSLRLSYTGSLTACDVVNPLMSVLLVPLSPSLNVCGGSVLFRLAYSRNSLCICIPLSLDGNYIQATAEIIPYSPPSSTHKVLSHSLSGFSFLD